MKVSDVMMPKGTFPILTANTLFKLALDSMSAYNLGIACLIDDNQVLLGIITDGDIRRRILSDQRPISALFMDDAIEHAIKKPLTVFGDSDLASAVKLMEESQVWDLPVVCKDGTLTGMLHLHGAVKLLLGI